MSWINNNTKKRKWGEFGGISLFTTFNKCREIEINAINNIYNVKIRNPRDLNVSQFRGYANWIIIYQIKSL